MIKGDWLTRNNVFAMPATNAATIIKNGEFRLTCNNIAAIETVSPKRMEVRYPI